MSVALILKESKLSRATFYHYFESKWEVVNYLAVDVMSEIYEHIQQFVGREESSLSREQALRRSIIEGCEIWAKHRAVLRTIVDHWREVPELRGMLGSILAPFQSALAAELDRERAEGHAPPGMDSEKLIAGLLWSSLGCLHAAGLPEVESIPDETAASSVLIALWSGALHGTTTP